MDRIIKESPLIQIYRDCHVNIEENFVLTRRTVNHTAPDMTKTLQALGDYLQNHSPFNHQPQRRSSYVIPNMISKGVELLMTREDKSRDEEVEMDEMGPDGDDLAVEL